MYASTDSTWRRAFYGIGALLIVIPGLLLGVSVADAGGVWPALADVRYALIAAGLAVLIGLRIGERVRRDRRE